MFAVFTEPRKVPGTYPTHTQVRIDFSFELQKMQPREPLTIRTFTDPLQEA